MALLQHKMDDLNYKKLKQAQAQKRELERRIQRDLLEARGRNEQLEAQIKALEELQPRVYPGHLIGRLIRRTNKRIEYESTRVHYTKRLTRSGLARAIRYSPPSVIGWLEYTSPMPFEAADRIMVHLKLTVLDLLKPEEMAQGFELLTGKEKANIRWIANKFTAECEKVLDWYGEVVIPSEKAAEENPPNSEMSGGL